MIKAERVNVEEKSGVNVILCGTKEELLNDFENIVRTFLKYNKNFTIEEITASICLAYKQMEQLERLIELVEILKEGV